ncbi:MAG: TetR/AcrR family transcriptional regulator [Hyphomonadaceae bacterium]|nr:TetR/AcrR family transcriptional regulator [Hyphomonadaceae bacterium]
MKDAAPSVARRRAPSQSRSQTTVDAILEATAALLVERGYEGVNTNAVAQRAEVKPPAVYRYFPNKFALYFALAEKLQGELDIVLDAALAQADGRPFAAVIDALIDGAAAFWERRPAFAALWYGQWAITGAPAPALLFGERTISRFSAATARFRHLGPARERMALAAAMQIGIAIVNLAALSGPEDRPFMIGEAKRALLSYLLPLADPALL